MNIIDAISTFEFNEQTLYYILDIVFKSGLAVLFGGVIGSERARHGRAAGMRTHILVCLGAALTAMVGVFAQQALDNQGDILRLSAQVISGVGFLGAGMIILKNNNVITGLTTAAGVWTTSVIGIAVGCGYFIGALTVTILYLLAIIILGKVEKGKRRNEVYIEVDDMTKANLILKKIKEDYNLEFTYAMVAPKSNCQGHLGIQLVIAIDKVSKDFNVYTLCDIENVVFVELE